MSKADTLLKKATSFERLALYSDRKVFLQALSQDLTVDSQIEALFKKAYDLINQAGGDTSAIQNAWQMKKDPAALARAITAILPSLAGLQHADIANQLTQISMQINNLSGASTPQNHSETGTVPTNTALPKIDKNEQSALFDIVTTEGVGLPGKIDGILGPETKKAIEAFKKRFNLGNVLTDDQVLTYAKMMLDNDPKYKT